MITDAFYNRASLAREIKSGTSESLLDLARRSDLYIFLSVCYKIR
jgi:hypothetical protein